MGRTSIAKGSNARYYTHKAQVDYYLKAIGVEQEPAGVWAGRGLEDLGLVEGAEIDGQVMESLFDEWTDPRVVAAAKAEAGGEIERRGLKPDGRTARAVAAAAIERAREEGRLGTAPYQYTPLKERLAKALEAEPHADERRRAEIEVAVRKTQRSATKYYDITFSAPKSWSVLHAALQVAGMHEEADQVWAAMKTGNAAQLEYLQDHAGYTRVGHHSTDIEGRSAGRWVKADRWIVASFAQHTSRDDDPQLHIHNPVLAKVKATYVDPVTGREVTEWRAIDGMAIYRHAKAAEAVGTRAAEEELMRRLAGLRVAMRPDGKGREIVGIAAEILQEYSSRGRTIDGGVAELAAAYEARYGRPPAAYQLAKMAQHVALDSRAAKSSTPASREELLARWEAQAGRNLKETLADIPAKVLGWGGREVTEAEPFEPAQVIAAAVEAVQAERSEWTRADLAAKVQRALPDCLGGLSAQQSRALIEELTETAVRPGGGPVEVVGLTPPEPVEVPAEFRRPDGTSPYSAPGIERFATAEQLRREGRLLEAAQAGGAPIVDAELVERVIAGQGLNEAQTEAVRGIATSGRRVDVLIGPAGAGKSRAVSALCEVWEAGGGTVLGVAPSQRAADVLAEEGIDTVTNLEKFLQANRRIRDGGYAPADQVYRAREGMLVILDEAGMASTADMEEARQFIEAAGGKMLTSGDYRQVSAVEAGGMLQLLADDLENVYELQEVLRFTASWEGAASLRLREGETAALLEYDRHGRIRDGDGEAMAERAYQRWLADHLTGRESLLIAPTNAAAGELAMRARADLVRRGHVEPDGIRLGCNAEVEQIAGVGDRVALRKNNRRIRTDDGVKWVTNREVVTVTGRGRNGSLTVQYDDGRRARLPARYVTDHVELAYAGTIHSAQGRTVITCHALVDETMSREQLYVALTRGKDGNYAYVICEGDDLAQVAALSPDGGERGLQLSGTLDAAGAPVVADRWAVLDAVMANSEAQQTATAALRAEFERVNHLGVIGRLWDDLGARHAHQRCGQTLTGVLGPEEFERLAAADSYESLVRLVRHVDSRGHDGAAMLAGVTGARSLSGLHDVGAGLHARLRNELVGVEDWQRRNAEALGVPEPRPGWRSYSDRVPHGDAPYLQAMREAAQVMDARVAELGRRAAEQQPEWTQRLGPVPEDPIQRAAWEERAGIVARYREAHGYEVGHDAIGAAPPQGAVEAHAAWVDACQALGGPAEGFDYAALPDARLREIVAQYERELEWAPPNVDALLRETVLARDDYRVQAEQARTAQAAEVDPGRKGELADQAHSADTFAQLHADRAEKLEKVLEGYDAWRAHTDQTRVQAEAARTELDRRHPDQAHSPEPEATVEPEQEQPAMTPHLAERSELAEQRRQLEWTEGELERLHAARLPDSLVDRQQEELLERQRNRLKVDIAEQELHLQHTPDRPGPDERQEPSTERAAHHYDERAPQASADVDQEDIRSTQADRRPAAEAEPPRPGAERDVAGELNRAVGTAQAALQRIAEQRQAAEQERTEEAERNAAYARSQQAEAQQIQAERGGPQLER